MNLQHSMNLRVGAAILSLALLVISGSAANTDQPAISAQDLAARLAALQDGSSYVRLRMEVKKPDGSTKLALQLQIKQRRTKTATDLVYQVLWPKERKGEAVLLHKADGHSPSGSLFTPPDQLHSLDVSQMNEALFGSNLSYQDIVENFFAWDNQSMAGTEVLNGINCLILESRPGKGDSSTYTSVRTWVDSRRFVALRIEKYVQAGQPARRIETTRVVTDDLGRSIPGNLLVRSTRGDSITDLDGSRIKHDVAYADREFTPEGLREVSIPHTAPE